MALFREIRQAEAHAWDAVPEAVTVMSKCLCLLGK
jgi:hypothetical protein